jgi:nicotinate-nucleotide adenylyltransferase
LTRRIGLLGGTFDPIHIGHLQLAEQALSKCRLFKILFIPSANPPHKLRHHVVDFNHRVNMVRIALTGRQNFQLSELEAVLPAPSYTIDTLTFLINHQNTDEEFYFIIGEDAFLEIDSWKSYEKLLSLTHFIVCGRGGYSPEYFQLFAQNLGYTSNGEVWEHAQRENRIIFLPQETENISSTVIREKIRKNMSLKGIVPQDVVSYIQKYRLYR